MNSKNRKTLEALFATPQRKAINWLDIETLLLAVGAELVEGRGSRLRFEAAGQMLALHKPHPGKEALGYQVKAIRDFLKQIGVTP